MRAALAGLLMLLPLCLSAAAADRFISLFDDLLREYWRPAVTINGIETTVFDYAAMARQVDRSDAIFAKIDRELAKVDVRRLDDAAVAKAFWINVYNYGAMRLVASNYPVRSIRSFKISLVRYPWSKKVIRVGTQQYTLSQIEHDILLTRYHDPRIVFAVSCAAVSCPDRIPEAFWPQRLDEQLDNLIRNFFKNTGKGLSLDRETGHLTLSWILDKDAALFAAYPSGVRGFVSTYATEEVRQWLSTHEVQLRYFDHDWSLNDVALADNLP